MLKTTLPGTELTVSRFAFGTSSLLRVGTARQRANLLAAAYDNGFTHFDTAPYYGFGAAERDLKGMLAAHRDVTVASKVGLYSPGGESQPVSLVIGRKIVGKALPAVSRPIADWSVARARQSLTGSLKRLGRDYLDLYLLHEPDRSVLNSEEWLRWLERERERVRYFGIAVTNDRLAPFLTAGDPLAFFVQTEDDEAGRGARLLAAHGRPVQITYGFIREALRRGQTDILAVLAAALARSPRGSIIVGTSKPDRLRQYAELADTLGPRDDAAARGVRP